MGFQHGCLRAVIPIAFSFVLAALSSAVAQDAPSAFDKLSDRYFEASSAYEQATTEAEKQSLIARMEGLLTELDQLARAADSGRDVGETGAAIRSYRESAAEQIAGFKRGADGARPETPRGGVEAENDPKKVNRPTASLETPWTLEGLTNANFMRTAYDRLWLQAMRDYRAPSYWKRDEVAKLKSIMGRKDKIEEYFLSIFLDFHEEFGTYYADYMNLFSGQSQGGKYKGKDQEIVAFLDAQILKGFQQDGVNYTYKKTVIDTLNRTTTIKQIINREQRGQISLVDQALKWLEPGLKTEKNALEGLIEEANRSQVDVILKRYAKLQKELSAYLKINVARNKAQDYWKENAATFDEYLGDVTKSIVDIERVIVWILGAATTDAENDNDKKALLAPLAAEKEQRELLDKIAYRDWLREKYLNLLWDTYANSTSQDGGAGAHAQTVLGYFQKSYVGRRKWSSGQALNAAGLLARNKLIATRMARGLAKAAAFPSFKPHELEEISARQSFAKSVYFEIGWTAWKKLADENDYFKKAGHITTYQDFLTPEGLGMFQLQESFRAQTRGPRRRIE